MQYCIVLVDSSRNTTFGLSTNLSHDGYEILEAHSASSALGLISTTDPDLVLLDPDLYDGDGLELMERIHASNCSIPFLILTARCQEHDRVEALRRGACDFMSKPFSVLELLERVRLRLRPAGIRSRTISSEGLVINRGLQEVRIAGNPIALSPKEFALLDALVSAEGRVMSRPQLLELVWGVKTPIHTRTVDYHVHQLRSKLRSSDMHSWIITVAKRGFAWRVGGIDHKQLQA